MTSKRPEKVEEKKFADKIKSNGWICFKLATQGSYGDTGYDDRLVLAPYGVHVLFEFKREGNTEEQNLKAEKLQNHRHKNLIEMGHSTYVVYKAEAAYSILLEHVRRAKRSWETEHGSGASYRTESSS